MDLPRVSGQVCKLPRQGKSLNLVGDSHLEVSVCFAVHDKVQERLGRRVDIVEELGRVLGVDILSLDPKMSAAHLSERPSRRVDDASRSVGGEVEDEATVEEVGVAAGGELGPILATESTDTREVIDFEILESVEEYIELEVGEVVADDDIGIVADDGGY